jgi:Holliday junction resolvase RusA-like endonuclease
MNLLPETFSVYGDAVYSFFVAGSPAPGGSKRFVGFGKKTGRAILIDDAGARNKNWRACVAQVAAQFCKGPLTGALECGFHFVMPRPKAHYRTGKHAGELRPDAPHYHTTKPDLTKLIRSTEDALTGFAWVDDSQLARHSDPTKVYGDTPGCLIVVRRLT